MIWAITWDFQQCGMCDWQSLRSACVYRQSDQSFCLSLEYLISVQLLTEHHLEFLSIKGGCTGSSQSTLVKMPHCWKSHVTAQLCFFWPSIRQRKAQFLDLISVHQIRIHNKNLSSFWVIEFFCQITDRQTIRRSYKCKCLTYCPWF